MGKITTLLLMMSGIDLLFYFTGLSTSSNTLLNLLLNPSTIIIASIISGVTTFAIALGSLFLTTGSISSASVISNVRYAYVIPFVLYISKLMGDGLVVFNKIAAVNAVFAILFASPLFIVAMLSVYALWDSGITV